MEDSSTKEQSFILGLWGVRYQVKEVQRSIAFYTKMLGFNLDQQNLPAFGQVSIGNFKLILSGPGASGSRPMPEPSARAWWMEPNSPSNSGLACTYCRTQEGGSA